MTPSTSHMAQWSTSSFGAHADTATSDLQSLHAHMTYCKKPRHVAFVLKRSSQHLYGFVVTRVFTSALLGFGLIAALTHWW